MSGTPTPSQPEQHDLVIIGAGPAGLAAALYAAREDLRPLVLEKAVVGGLAAITATIENYPGFENGVGGLELADHLLAHAKRFGAEVRSGPEVVGLARTADGLRLTLANDQPPILAQAVLIATGSTYRHLGAPGEAELIGRGVHFCATCDGPIYRGRELVVVGGGNSALQETLFLAKFARHITMLVRGPELKGSAILRHQVAQLTNVTVVSQLSVTSLARAEPNGPITLETTKTGGGAGPQFTADGAFVFIGLLANTAPFAKTLELDARGFIVATPDYATSLRGVFVAGDVRSGSTWQIASAVGEGVAAALSIRTYLDGQRHQTAA
ncbi:MAG TPA: FAD-dependent oxidoreductase [Candidatus Saccharimonadia bacterium]|nr:FAD-dependent oxidoreductase [Candidatus Saccharimonadia bacterium]